MAMSAAPPLLPHLRTLTAELLARLHHASSAAASLQNLDVLFQQKQNEFNEKEGFGPHRRCSRRCLLHIHSCRN